MSIGTITQTNGEARTVVLNFITLASITAIWSALTEPAIVDQWFGTLTSKLSLGHIKENANVNI